MSGDDTDSIGLRITLRDVYREQQEMKSLLEKLANNLPGTEEKLTDTEIRLRKLEMRSAGCRIVRPTRCAGPVLCEIIP